MKKIYLAIILFYLTIGAFAQKQVIKITPVGFAYGRYNLQYERMLTDYSSFNVSASYLKPNLFGLEDIINTMTAIGISTEMSLSGAAFCADYRLYSQNATGPRGFYIAPYLRYTGVGFKMKTEVDYPVIGNDGQVSSTNTIETGLSVARYGFGLKVGAQWLIKNRVSIDWNFAGIGADFYKSVLSEVGTSYVEQVGVVSIQEDTVDYSWLYAFTTNFTIGFAF